MGIGNGIKGGMIEKGTEILEGWGKRLEGGSKIRGEGRRIRGGANYLGERKILKSYKDWKWGRNS